jgi:hypothetical protein
MKADKFNEQFEELFVRPLVSAGFTRQRSTLLLARGPAKLAVFRQHNKWSALCQDTHFTVCVRHYFLSDLQTSLGPIYDYPFKIQPSRMTPGFFASGWHYESYNEIGRWPLDVIDFGLMRTATQFLTSLRETVQKVGIRDGLSPACRGPSPDRALWQVGLLRKGLAQRL